MVRFWSRLISAIMMVMVVLNIRPVLAAGGNQQPPRLLNLWFTWQLPEDAVASLAKWDVVVLDMDQQARYPDRIRELRRLNPNIKILAYVDSSNIATARLVEESNFPGYALAHAATESWYMHRGSNRVSMWSGAWMMNMTGDGPTDTQGRRWQDFLPQFIQEQVWSTGLWDGIFLDNAIDNATYFVGKGLDVTGDGQAENDTQVDRDWKAGWQKMAQNLRNRLGSKALIMGNGSSAYANVTNGILFENFPRYGWDNGFRDYQNSIKTNTSPSITAFNSNPNNVNQPASWQLMRFTLGSALLGDGYYSFDYGDRDHGQTWWYDEYDAILGNPTNAPEKLSSGAWWRDYERGAALVNTTSKSVTVDLPGVFERLRGIQDPATNNGRLETSITLAPQDGLIIYRRTQAAAVTKSTAYRNGDFVRVYHPDGTQARAGFFVQRSGVTGGSTVLVNDLDGDGKQDVMVGTNGTITITYGKGGSKAIHPFGTTYHGAITLAAGNTDRDTPLELVAGSANGEVRVLEQDGTTRASWRPYATFRGSINVALGDIDGDGLREVVTGAGPGGGPHVRIFKTDGQSWGGSWFAFDALERGGVYVTVGDINSDGRDDIIAGSGAGSVPRVRIFNAQGSRSLEFALSSQIGSLGARVSLSDVDGDGHLEILSSGVRPTP
jgi:hypothetical protein